MSMTFEHQIDEVYPPREDTYLLLRASLKEARADDVALEIGCGCGLISQEVAPRVKSILATDINPHAARMAKEKGLEVVRSDLFSGLRGKFDLILFNPPYLPTTDLERTDQWIDFALDGGDDGRKTIRRFLKGLSGHLRPGGRALLLVSSLTGLHEVRGMAEAEGLDVRDVARHRFFFEQLHVLRLEVAHSR
ncbi:MAG: putative S-adenosylmethionine-dependent methyltransferase [Methanosaeta sp. PtaB.Bin018]|nr:MAG: putative S-adenosylmethionine-dependent methyltransferase [Methanosaeta sp. PtaB.Bin018]OPY43236.1 MAG: putative S-adenosylmethionine-dependent methyltransferase [Methanosaeta sp. PtaU1.Bin016]